MTLLKTPCVSIQTAGAGVNYSGGVTANASAGGVTATADPNCPEILLTSLSYTLYQDRNNNDQKDPGEEIASNEVSGPGEPNITAGGFSATINVADGPVKFSASATDSGGTTYKASGRL